MTIGRMSALIAALSSALTRTVAIILLAGLLPGVKADCWIDSDGFEHCDGLSTGSRVGIGIGLWIIFLCLIIAAIARRRRRAAQTNLVYVQENHQGGGNAYGGRMPIEPQYPPQAYSPGGVHLYAYVPNAGSSPHYSPGQSNSTTLVESSTVVFVKP